MRVECDYSLCMGCLACVVSCLDHHYAADEDGAVSGRKYGKVVLPSGTTMYHTESCRHCEDAPCLENCTVQAISRTEKGWVVVDREACIGCRVCQTVCPYDIPQFNAEGKMVKCDGCCDRPHPACISACPMGALSLQ